MSKMFESRMSSQAVRVIQAAFVATALTLASSWQGALAASEQAAFESAEAAVTALLDSLKERNVDALATLFGKEQWESLAGPDKIQAREGLEKIYEAAQVSHTLAPADGGGKILMIGSEAWPFPIPLISENGKWRFDTAAGMEEILNRRIGGNELTAIAVMREYVEAQIRYARADRDGDDVLEYAQKINSSSGQRDGLYWVSQEPGDESPLGPFVSESAAYLEGREAGDPFKGYFFKVLSRQGAGAPGGRYDYVINGNMIGGFAMVAYPAEYGNSGIMSFLINQQGVVYERDLGEETITAAQSMTEYEPGGWLQSKD